MDYIEILLPTFNGEKYLNELMDSLVSQTYKKFKLITYDDGSSDKSAQIVDSYRDRLDIIRVKNEVKENRGALEAFVHLLRKAEAETIMLCDQDDIWMKNKIYEKLKYINMLEKKHGKIPLLVFSDLEIIDESGQVINKSFLKNHRFNLHLLDDIYYLCFKNAAPGCSMILNRELLKKSLPIGSGAIMHDWWLMINASINGMVGFIEEPLIKYRKHSSNTIGPVKDNPNTPVQSILTGFSLNGIRAFNELHRMLIKQAREAFSHNGKTFFVSRYFLKLFTYRYIYPLIGQFSKKHGEKSWR